MTDTFESILSRRLSRRGLLGAGLLAVPAAIVPAALTRAAQVEARTAAGSLGFKAIAGSRADEIRVAENHTSQVVIRWGDPLLPGARPVDTSGLAAGALFAPGSAAAQERQFGYNCDAIAFYPLDRDGRSGILCVNNEYTNDELMFPGRIGLGREGADRLARLEPQESRSGAGRDRGSRRVAARSAPRLRRMAARSRFPACASHHRQQSGRDYGSGTRPRPAAHARGPARHDASSARSPTAPVAGLPGGPT